MKVAHCIGINYNMDPDQILHGCINDALNISSMLRQKGYMVTIATDEKPKDASSSWISRLSCAGGALAAKFGLAPSWAKSTTRSAILGDMKRMLATNGTVVITYSGHGSQTTDRNKDEVDGKDECICPWDGRIYDDELRSMLNGFKGTLFMLVDACHSGTMLDLPFVLDPETLVVSEHGNRADLPFRVVTISGCRDDQQSSDAENVAGTVGATGALTAVLLAALKTTPPTLPLKSLAMALRKELRSAGFSQVCQIAVSQKALLDEPISIFF